MQHRVQWGQTLLAIFILTITLLAPSSVRAKQQELAMGMVAADSKELTLKRWQPVVEALSKQLGVPVKAVAFNDYASVIWHLASGKIQFAWGGNKSAIEAVDRANCEIVLKTINVKNGGGYYSHLIVPADSALNNVDDVIAHASQLTFGNGDPNSTSGFVVPGYYIFASRNLTPKKLFKRVINNNHETNFHNIASGKIDVATSNSLALGRYESHFPDELTKTKIIWTSPQIPSDPIFMRKNMQPELRRRIIEFFKQYGKPTANKSTAQLKQEQTILTERKWTGFIPSNNTQLTPIRKLELFKKRLRIERNKSLTEAAKKHKIAEIDSKLKNLK